MSLHKEKVEGTLTSLYLTPTPHFLSLLARSLTVLTWTALAGVIGLLIAQVVAGPVEFYQPGLALLSLLFTLGGLIGLGFAVAGLAVRVARDRRHLDRSRPPATCLRESFFVDATTSAP